MLNKEQNEAVKATQNVVIVIAGAGSGKTTVLVQRINRLISEGVKAKNILAITFTNKAAQEMKTRLLKSVGNEIFQSTIVTFHALAMKIIKENIDELKNHNRHFLIIDDDDKKRILKNIIKELNIDVKVPEVMGNFGYAKSRSLTYKNVEMLIEQQFIDIYTKYAEYCNKNNAFDFDDLLLVAYHLLKIKKVRQKYNDLFKHIHVDEYQDTSLIQGEILKKIKAKENTLFIVGDVDQSIYTWRGATIENLLNLQEEYEDVKQIKLEQNYRSTKQILLSANKLIENNENRIKKKLWTENEKGKEIDYFQVNTNIDEAMTIIREINSIVDYGESYDKFAVLYRYNYQSRKIEEMLVKNRIPYQIYGGIRFYERMEIKDILAYLRIMINPRDNISLLRIINTPKRKVGEKTIIKLQNYATENNFSIYDAILEIGNKALITMTEVIKKYKDLVITLDRETFEEKFNDFLEELEYEKYLLTSEDKSKVEDRMNNVRELKEGFIQEIELGREISEYINELALIGSETNTSDDMVILSTIHGVKGLEFENVFMVGMIEGKFPKANALYDEEEMEEERRLAYVGITRAEKKLTVISYKYDFKYDLQEPSRFIEEMGLETEDKQKEEINDGFIF